MDSNDRRSSRGRGWGRGQYTGRGRGGNRGRRDNYPSRGRGYQERSQGTYVRNGGRSDGPGRPSRGMADDGMSMGASFEQRGQASQREQRAMGYKRLQELTQKEPIEIVLTLNSGRSGFKELLDEGNIRKDLFVLLLAALAKACDCNTSPMSVNGLLGTLQNSQFLMVHLTLFMALMPTECSHHKQLEFPQHIKDIAKILKTVLQRSPSSYVNVIPALSTLESTVSQLRASTNIIDGEISKVVDELKDLRNDVLETELQNTKRKEGKHDMAEEDPPDNFREIPIFPGSNDIHTDIEPFIRPNVVKGGYKEVEHYLDVQFRLLREDFMAPLRVGISAYLAMLRDPLAKTKQLQEIRLYHGVRIEYPSCTWTGVVHRIKFDETRLKYVRWQASKRLIFGSLLCLSKDDFNTLLFATVANRSAADLEQGYLDVRFEDMTQVARISPKDEFVMAESSAYFEAYRHVLKGLQEITDDSLPFKPYIINVATEVSPPKYLRHCNPIYDLRPLVQEPDLKVKAIRGRLLELGLDDDELDLDDDVDLRSDSDSDEDQYEYRSNNPQLSQARAVPILQLYRWPQNTTLKLDRSQLAAVQTALTKEFAVIQGPPGTGKTYIGLKIVRTLLYNRRQWSRDRITGEMDRRPIFVVCFTNHALDQFLEGILEFQKHDLVRVGGRSASEILKKYNLNVLKSERRTKHSVPKHIYTGLWTARDEMRALQEPMERASELIDATRKGILSEDCLQPFIDRDHLESLTEMMMSMDKSYLGKMQSAIPLWLGLTGEVFVQEATGIDAKKPKLIDKEEQDGEEKGDDEEDMIDLEEEAELEEDLRLLDDEDKDDPFFKSKKVGESKHAAMATIAVDIDTIANQAHQMAAMAGGWQIKRKRKGQWKREMAQRLTSKDIMTDDEAGEIDNVWLMELEQRWRLYRLWIANYCDHQKRILEQHYEKYDAVSKQLKEVQDEEHLAILKNAAVIGMTTTGAAKYRNLIQQIHPKIVIVEEAAEVLEAHIVTTLTKGCEHLILIGDHQQLRPNPTVYRLAKKFHLDVSLFERMVNNGMQCQRLSQQHRMRPEIAELMKHFYKDLFNHESVFNFENIKGVSSNIYFVDHRYKEEGDGDTKSKSNTHEAKFLTALCKYFLQQGYSPSQITILTTYTGQLFIFRKLMPRQLFQGVRVSVVDNFQGEENDIILLSLVRSNIEGKIGFLKISNRICVALSRAKKGFFCIGNFSQLTKEEDLWSKIIHDMRKIGNVGERLRLTCQNHPQNIIEVTTDKDFSKAPEGGCTRPCEYRLNCGHKCEMVCHPRDREHTLYKCRKPCEKIMCEREHKCPKYCYQDCGNSCIISVKKILPKCGHEQQMPCHNNPMYADCKSKCTKLLSCGHRCKNKCGEPCMSTDQCQEVVIRSDWLCGHKVKVKCSDGPENCPYPCKVVLKCEHKCKGTCGKCRNGRLHLQCRKKCGRVLVCGHTCEDLCSKNCPPCKRKCENRCTHSKCPKDCGEVCKPCKEACEWSCKHHVCRKRCGQICVRPVCNEPCDKLLRCKHQCIGICGEPCPKKCRICDRDEVTDIFLGGEDEDDARFIQLLDCPHYIEVEGLDRWMEMNDDNGSNTLTIQFKACPKCKTPIRKSWRYGNVIKRSIEDIQLVKAKIIGDANQRRETKQRLQQEVRRIQHIDITISRQLKSDLEQELTMEQLCQTENKMAFLKTIAKIRRRASTDIKTALMYTGDFLRLTQSSSDTYGVEPDGYYAKIVSELEYLQSWLMNPRPRLSEQEIADVTMEIQRVNLLCSMYSIQCKVLRNKINLTGLAREYLGKINDILTKGVALSESKEKEVTELLKVIQKLHPEIGETLSAEERKMIVKAMEFTQGHWFKCPNGHIYAIGDCGGATVESTCPECKARIGGSGHRLRDDNRLAPEMDGANYAAWSEQANLENYEMDDF
ncbi:NFX1-type zinc finger-containing protein 1-like [Glandiceps talaboti]